VRTHCEAGDVIKMLEVMKQARHSVHVQVAACRALARAASMSMSEDVRAQVEDRVSKQLQAAARAQQHHAITDEGESDLLIKAEDLAWDQQLIGAATAEIVVSTPAVQNAAWAVAAS
jgi:hypothetical protein